MTLTGLILFSTVYGLAAASPGPGIMALVARVLARGRSGVWAFLAGYVLGDLTWFTLAATGLAVVAQTFHALFLVIKYLGVAYLVYLAWRFWTAPAAEQGTSLLKGDRPGRQFLASLTLTLGNPKVMVFFLAILPTVIDLRQLTFAAGLELGGLIAVLLSVILSLYVVAAGSARTLFRTPRAMRLLNRISGGAIAAAALAVASR